jgi:hypothetical protein
MICSRCTTHLMWAAEICPSCGLTLAAPLAPVAPFAEAAPSGPITYEPVPDNPWRQGETFEAAPIEPAPIEAQQFAPIEEPAAVEAPAAAPAPAPIPAPVAAYTPPPLGTPIALTFADPLPPLAAPSAPAEYVAVAVASSEPTIPVALPESTETAPRVAVADDDLGVPAAYAPFAPETNADVAAAPAEVVELIPATGLTIAPPAVETPGWPAAAGEAAAL